MKLRAFALLAAPPALLLSAFACGGVGETDLFGTGGSSSGTGGASSSSGASTSTSSSGASTSSSSGASTSSSSSTSASSSSGAGGASSSSSSGSFCGNNICEPGEDAVFCPQDCTTSGPSGSSSSSGGGTCDHSPCQQGGPLATACDACAATVCPADPYCCDTAWDGQCVNEANQMCAQCSSCGNNACDNGETCTTCPADCGVCPPTACEHSVCFVGNKLDPMLCTDPCVDEVCMQQASCCGGPNWNQGCEDLADMLCPGTDPCVSAVCAADPTCCNVSWTQACVDQAVLLCNTACDCVHSICAQGEKLAASCNPCATAVCAVDDYCCNQAWDGICVGEVEAICGITCQ